MSFNNSNKYCPGLACTNAYRTIYKGSQLFVYIHVLLSSHCCDVVLTVDFYGRIPAVRATKKRTNAKHIPDTPCMVYLPISWGGLGGQCMGIYGSIMECLGIFLEIQLYRTSGR